MIPLRIIILLFSIFAYPLAKAGMLSTTEQQISHYIVKAQTEQLSLLEKLVNINSGTSHLEGVRQVGEMLKPQFEQLGFNVQWIEEPTHMHRAGTLLAQRHGSKGKKLLLIAHLDTVFPSDSPFQRFKKLNNNTATGPGIIDDKGGDVVILYALKALQATHALDDTNIIVALMGDEEDSGKPVVISRKPLMEAAKLSDIALDFEWAITQDTATIARRGITKWTLATQGKEGHSSEIFQKSLGDGAIFELCRILNTWRTQLSNEKYLSFNPGIVLGGTSVTYDKNLSQGTSCGKENVIAKTAIATGDLRFLTQTQETSAKKTMTEICAQHLPGTNATITFQAAIPSMPPTNNNLKLLQKYSAVSTDLGYGPIKPLDPEVRGAGDISHIATIVSANLAGLGPVGTGAHSTKETLIIDSLPIQTQRAALLIYRLVNEKHSSDTSTH